MFTLLFTNNVSERRGRAGEGGPAGPALIFPAGR